MITKKDKIKKIQIRVSKDEKNDIEYKAELLGFSSVSEYIRYISKNIDISSFKIKK